MKNNDIQQKYDSTKQEIRIGIVGNVDVGKTSLISVLTNNILDNGRGLARQRIMKHPHEKESGRTSSITLNFMRTFFNSLDELNDINNKEIFNYNKDGSVKINSSTKNKKSNTFNKLKNEKVISLIDLAGHEKYLKTTIRGINGCMVDYICILIGANSGVQRMTKEHLGVAMALNIPLIIIITKVDMAPKPVLNDSIQSIKRVLKKKNMKTINMNDVNDIKIMKEFYKSGNSKSIIPLFKVSSVSGIGLGLFKQFIFNLESYKKYASLVDNKPHFIIESTYQIPGIGVVVSGTMKTGIIKKGDCLKLGPYKDNFINIVVKSIHNNFKEDLDFLQAGEGGCFAIKQHSSEKKTLELKRNAIKKGMRIMKDLKLYYEFEADVLVLHHPTTIQVNYEPTIHCGTVTQTAKICSMETDTMRSGDRSKIKFRFIHRPEYLEKNNYLVFREGQTKGIGRIVNLL